MERIVTDNVGRTYGNRRLAKLNAYLETLRNIGRNTLDLEDYDALQAEGLLRTGSPLSFIGKGCVKK